MRCCTIPDCGGKHYARGFCRTHYGRWQRHRDPHRVDVPRCHVENVTYQGLHNRLRRGFGLPSEHCCVQCGNQASDWAYDHMDPDERRSPQGWPYSLDLTHYSPLCKPCHVAIDHGARWGRPAALAAVYPSPTQEGATA